MDDGKSVFEIAIRSQIVVFPDYGQGKELYSREELKKEQTKLSSGSLSHVAWTPLKGSKKEGTHIKRILGRKGTLVMGSDATETFLKSIKSPSILHIATHGFFLSDVDSGALRDQRSVFLEKNNRAFRPRAPYINPLLRSGVVLAGVSGKGEDGVMAAKEFSSLNLRGTQLVTLSA